MDEVHGKYKAYEIGDSGSNWRMMKLQKVYDAAKADGISLEEVALQRYASLEEFDLAREEKKELKRRQKQGYDKTTAKSYVTGSLYAARLEKNGSKPPNEGIISMPDSNPPAIVPIAANGKSYDLSALNKLQARVLKAELTKAKNLEELKRELEAAKAQYEAAQTPQEKVIILTAEHTRQMPAVKDEIDMTVEELAKEERRKGRLDTVTRIAATRIAGDKGYEDDEDYTTDNAARLAAGTKRKQESLKNVAIQDYKKMQKVLDTCPLCEQDSRPPIAPIISLATRIYLSLPTEPELARHSALIVPLTHRVNMLECDDDEWEEVRNFMKSLIMMYAKYDMTPIFYENAASPKRKRHAAIHAVPLKNDIFPTAKGYFRQSLLMTDDPFAQHPPIIDTLANVGKYGKHAFRSTLVKEMPYFHVWFTLDGGMGHIVEDDQKWGEGELWAREVLGGGVLALEDVIWRKMGRWKTGKDVREDDFRSKWDAWDWTKALA